MESNNPVIARWASDIRSLPDEHRQRFLKEMPDGDLHKFANAIEEVIMQRVKSSRTLQAGQWTAPLGQLVEMTKPFAGAIESAFPPAGLILGGISVLLTTTKNFVDYQESVIRLLQKVLANLNILEKFKSTIPKTQEIQLVLVTIYGDLVKFLAKAVRPFLDKKGRNRIGLVSMAKSIWKPFNAEFDNLEKHLDDHLAAFRLALSLHSQKEQYKGSKLQEHTFGMLKDTEQRRTLLEKESGVKETAKAREELRREILDWIPHISFDHIQDDKHSNSLPTTGGWLFDHDAFRAWNVGEHPNILWITGKAGSGKSHLAAHTIHNIRESCRGHCPSLTDHQYGKGYSLAFIYCASNANAGKSSEDIPVISTLLGSILRQLYAQLPNDTNVESIRRRHTESKFDGLRRAEIKDGIRSIVREFKRAYIVVDGLDECSGLPGDDFKELCQFLGSFGTKGMPATARLVIFSRPGYPTINSALSNVSEIQVDDGSNINDIKMFVEDRTADLAKKPSVLQQIQKSLLDGADGVFLWVSLSIKIIEMETSDRAKMTAARNTWGGLEELYSEMLRRILAQPSSRRKLALNALLWVANSHEPLSKEELVHALSFEPGMESLDNDDIIDENIILSSCADLLVEKIDHYELVHFSLAEFLRSDAALQLIDPGRPRCEEDEPNAVLARSCMGYLLLDEFKGGPVDTFEAFESLAKQYSLLRYAALHWGTHLRRSMNPKNLNLARDILQTTETRNFSMQTRDFYLHRGKGHIFPWPGKVEPLHVIAGLGLQELLQLFPQATSQINLPDGFSWYPIDYAVQKKRKPMFEWILSHKDNIDDKVTSTNPLNSRLTLVVEAARNGWADIVSTLISLGFDRDGRDRYSSAAWHLATYHGDMDTAEVLIKAGADPNPRDKIGDTPLKLAVIRGQVEIVRRLLEHGADVNAQNASGLSALHLLAVSDKVDMVDELVPVLCDHGADTELHDEDGYTPLLLAAVKDNTTALKHLLSKGADLTASVKGLTILHLASYHGSSLVMKFLLGNLETLESSSNSLAVFGKGDAKTSSTDSSAASSGHNQLARVSMLNAKDDYGEWPIHSAAKNGHLECAAYLYKLDPTQVNQKSHAGITPLHFAVEGGHMALVSFLLDRGAEINTTRGRQDFKVTPLHQAMRNGRSDVAVALIRKGADPSLETLYGDTAWDYAAMFGAPEVIHCVLGNDPALPNDISHLLQAMRSAITHQDIDVVSTLLSSYGSPSFFSEMEDSRFGLLAIEIGSLEIWKLLISSHSSLAHGVYPDGSNALHAAAMYGRADILGHLCERGFDIDQPDFQGRSPLLLGARNYMTGCVKVLCDKGANINHVDSCGRTALHYAARSGGREATKRLLQAGSNIHIRDSAGFCAADYATSNIQDLLRNREEAPHLSKSFGSSIEPKEAMELIIQKIQSTEVLVQPAVERQVFLEILCDLLWKVGAYREAGLFFRSADRRSCDICRGVVAFPFYHCTECLDVDVCLSCHQIYIQERQGGLSQLESLELWVQPTRRALLHASQFGSATILQVIDSVEGISDYFQEISRRYFQWANFYNTKGQLREWLFPGWLLALIIYKLKGFEDSAVSVDSTGHMDKINSRASILGIDNPTFHLRYLFENYSPAAELSPFRCYSHAFLKVPDTEGPSNESQAFFENKVDMSESFFTMLKEKVAKMDIGRDPGNTQHIPVSPPVENKMTRITPGENLNDNGGLQLPDTLDPSRTSPLEGAFSLPDEQGENDLGGEGNHRSLEQLGDSNIMGVVETFVNEARESLLLKMRNLQPDDDSLARGEGMVLETAWSLVQAMVYRDEARFPRLVEQI